MISRFKNSLDGALVVLILLALVEGVKVLTNSRERMKEQSKRL